MSKSNILSSLANDSQFKLGNLTTEGFHPLSNNLSRIPLKEALAVCHEIDKQALNILLSKEAQLLRLQAAIQKAMTTKKRIFLCGCGATGRLVLSLEFLFRQKFSDEEVVVAFMAGGDYALVKSVESFEDSLELGARQLDELGFSSEDMLVACTEGGETSFVIGAANRAVALGSKDVFFLYCNPDEELAGIERSQDVLANPRISKINLSVGPMTISGSTRMQASSVQMLFLGTALLHYDSENLFQVLADEIESLINLDYQKLKPAIEFESKLYQNDKYLTYLSDPNYAICVLTDTTERSPTFGLRSFEKVEDNKLAWAYLSVKGTHDGREAWHKILGRAPRCLDWKELPVQVSETELYKFDVSENAIPRRSKLEDHEVLKIQEGDAELQLIFFDMQLCFKKQQSLFLNHLALKLLLNTLSTLVMCRMRRIEGNMMVFVKVSNKKLLDRASRYVCRLSEDKISYDEARRRVQDNVKTVGDNDSIVLSSL